MDLPTRFFCIVRAVSVNRKEERERKEGRIGKKKKKGGTFM